MSAPAGVRIAPVAAERVRPLRARVLRPGVPEAQLVYPGDAAPGALHLAALRGDEVVGIASLNPEPPPPVLAGAAGAPGAGTARAWRLRGMATAPEVRGDGCGALLLQGCFEHVRAQGGGLLWCNARLVALGFYEKLGLARIGERFEIGDIGPHYVMFRRLSPVT